MSLDQVDFEMDADLDRKAHELLKNFRDNFDDVDYDDIVNFLIDSSNNAVVSNDINYKACLYNMLFQKTDADDLFLTSVDNYKARLYGLALQKITLTDLWIEGTKGLNDAALLVKFVRNCNLRSLHLKSINNEGVLCAFIQAANANSNIKKINIGDSLLTPSVIQTILDQQAALNKVFDVDPWLIFRFKKINSWNSDGREPAIFIKHRNGKLPTDLVTLLTNPFQHCTASKNFRFDSISNDRNDLVLLDSVAANKKIKNIEIETTPISEVIIPMILNKSKSLKRLKVGLLNNFSYAFEWCSNQDHSADVIFRRINNKTAKFYENCFKNIIVRNLELDGDMALNYASHFVHFIRKSNSLESVELLHMSKEKVCELLKAAAQNVNITKISTCKIPQIEDIISTLLETSKSLTHLSMCGFSFDGSKSGEETVSIKDVDNRTIPLYVQALTKRRLVELQIQSDNGLDDGSLLIEWIKHSGSLKKFRCYSVRNEVVCRGLLEAAVSNTNVEHLYLEGIWMRFLSNVLKQSISLRCLELDEVDFDEEVLFEKEHLLSLFKRDHKHAQSRATIKKLVLHCGCYRNFENVISCLKENGTAGTFFNTIKLKLDVGWYGIVDRLVSSLPTMRGVHELEIHNYFYGRCFDAKDYFFIAMRKNFSLRRLTAIDESDDVQGKVLKVQNDMKMLCQRNETIQNWTDVAYSMPRQYLYRGVLICQMYEFSQEIIFDLLKKYWCRRADHVIEAYKSTTCSSSGKIQRKRKRVET